MTSHNRDNVERNLNRLLHQGVIDLAEVPDGLRILTHYIEQAVEGARRRGRSAGTARLDRS